MIMSLLAIVVTLGIGYLWATRGFFSALLHMACVVVAGAIAFALWEQVALALLDASPQEGFLSFLGGVAWGLGLALPFAISLAVIRIIVDVLIRANANTSEMYNYIGGGVCGVVSGAITAGILVLCIGFTRVGPGFLGYDRVNYAQEGPRGNLVRATKLWLPVDDLVAGFYGRLSQGALSVPEPLGEWYPDLADVPGAMRLTEFDGKARNTLRPSDFRVTRRYAVGAEEEVPLDRLLEDAWAEAPQNVAYLGGDSDRPDAQSKLLGYVVTFDAGAREETGQVLMGAGQIRLLIEDARTGERRDVYPIAVVAQADAANVEYVRYRYDAPGVFLASQGGATETTMAFEFVVPRSAEAKALYVRNVRVPTVDLPEGESLASAAARDRQIRTGALVGVRAGRGGLDLDDSAAETLDIEQADNGGGRIDNFPEFQMRTRISQVIQKGTERGLQTSPDNHITGGEAEIPIDAVGRGGLERNLQIREFQTTSDTVVVQLDVGPDSRTSLLGRAVASAERLGAPALIDTNGQRYDALGFIYEDRDVYHIKFSPGNPIRALQEVPQLSGTRRDQKLTLVFRPTRGVQIQSFVIGQRVVTEFDPPILLDANQRNR